MNVYIGVKVYFYISEILSVISRPPAAIVHRPVVLCNCAHKQGVQQVNPEQWKNWKLTKCMRLVLN